METGRGCKVWVQGLFVAAAIITFAAVALGSVVCATDSSAACPNWPGCYFGQIAPEVELNPIVEFVHRVVAVTSGPLLLAAAIVGLWVKDKLVKVLPWIAFAGAMIAGTLGMLTVKVGISKAWATFDLGSSLVALIAITIAAVCVVRAPRRWNTVGPAKLGWAAVGALLIYHLCSVLVAGSGSLTRCMSWPVWQIIAIDGNAGLQWVRLVLAGAATILVLVLAVLALRRSDTRWLGLLLLLLALIELGLGITVVPHGATLALKGWYAATAGGIFCVTTWIAALSSVSRMQRS